MKKRYFSLVIFTSFFLLTLLGFSSNVSAATTGKLSGYAWSSNIGWIDFGTGALRGVGGGVNINADGTISGVNGKGYAWSSNIGWIQFGELSDFPSGKSTVRANAKLVNEKFTGWARAVSAIGRTDGWDGWISLSGKASDDSNYGPQINNGLVSNYAYGSDVVGWINFNPKANPDGTSITPSIPNCAINCGVTAPVTNQTPTASLEINGSPSASIAVNSSAILTWTSANATSCSLSGGFVANNLLTSGSQNVGPYGSAQALVYTLNCTNDTNTATDSVTLNVTNSISAACSASPSNAQVNKTITWSVSPSKEDPKNSYLWSGDVGDFPSNLEDESFTTKYSTSGIKTATLKITKDDYNAKNTCIVNIINKPVINPF